MATCIALLRGINALGRKVVPMKALATALEREGLETSAPTFKAEISHFNARRGHGTPWPGVSAESCWTATDFSGLPAYPQLKTGPGGHACEGHAWREPLSRRNRKSSRGMYNPHSAAKGSTH
jgi:hypothetical protein